MKVLKWSIPLAVAAVALVMAVSVQAQQMQPRQTQAQQAQAQQAQIQTQQTNGRQAVTPAAQTGQAWRKVVSVSGSGSADGKAFTLKSTRQKLVYSMAGHSWDVAGVGVMRKGPAERSECEASVVMQGGTRGAVAISHLKPGRYYLSAFAPGAEWTVTLYEMR